MIRFLLTSFVLLGYLSATAQFIATYPKENPQLKTASAISQDNARQAATTRNSQMALDLPFFDDFSYTGPYPVASHWEDRQVFINNTWANEPVSVGVATFDGLDSSGSPYGGRAGSSDTLTSVPLNLDDLLAAHLSYYVQAKGLGDAPEPGSDLVLEFLTEAGEWEEINRHTQTIEFFPRDSVTQFAFVAPIPVNESRFLYDGFQFRFRNFSTRDGASDLWHIDYVRLEKTPPVQVVQDVAFTKLPQPLLTTYSSVPWSHFINPDATIIAEELRQEWQVELFNHSTQSITADDAALRLLNFTQGEEERIIPPRDLLANSSIVPDRQEVSLSIPFDYSDRVKNLQSNAFITENNFVTIRTQYQMDPSPQANIPEITRNDTVFALTQLDDYYAYDDGSAESAIAISGLGGAAAMEFYNYKPDSIRGFQIQIPRLVAGAANGNITLKIWLEDLNTPPIVELPISPFFLDEFRDTLQAFTTYALKDRLGTPTPVQLPVGTFYVGWEQGICQGTCVPVGLDRNRPELSEKVFINADGNWQPIANFNPLPDLLGVLMIRPILGNELPKESELSTSTNELLLEEVLQVFPNPSNGLVNVQLFKGDYTNYEVQIHTALGQLMEKKRLTPQLDVSDFSTGIYFLQFRNLSTNEVGNYKLVVKE